MVEEIIECETTQVDPQMIQVIRQYEIEPTTAEMLESVFLPYLKAAQSWADQAMKIQVNSITQTREMKFAKAARLGLRDIRLAAENSRKKLKEDSLRQGNAIQGMYNIVLAVVSPAEKHCQDQELFAERQAQREKEAKAAERSAAMKPYFGYYDDDVELSAFTDSQFAEYLAEAVRLKKEDDDAEEAAAAKAIADAEEARRLKAENDRLKAEVDEADRKAKAEQAARDFADQQAQKERERIANEEKAERDRVAAEAQAKIDAAEKARADAEKALKDKQDAEDKAKNEADRKAKAAAKAEADRPTVSKLLSLADSLETYELPAVDEVGEAILADVKNLLGKIAAHIRSKTAAL